MSDTYVLASKEPCWQPRYHDRGVADRLLNPMGRFKISKGPSLSSNAPAEPVEEKSPLQNLHHIESAEKLGKQVLQPNRPRPLSKYRAPSAKYESIARN